MSINDELFIEQEVYILKKELSGLNDVYRDIADKIGIENALEIYRMFHGNQISFPSKLFSKEYIHQAIINEYNGKNAKELAQKYNYSERSIWRILKPNK